MISIVHSLKLCIYTSSNFSEAATEVFCKKSVLRNFEKFTGKHLRQCLFFIQVTALMFMFFKTVAFETERCKRFMENRLLSVRLR